LVVAVIGLAIPVAQRVACPLGAGYVGVLVVVELHTPFIIDAHTHPDRTCQAVHINPHEVVLGVVLYSVVASSDGLHTPTHDWP
jgi:predicted ATP-grasp superfamily ATP-dependent carboligase